MEINLGALEENACAIRKSVPSDVALMAVVKADAYGHGAVMTIPTLEASGVTMVGVASMDEAIAIRKSGIEIPMLVIGGVPDWAAQMAAEHDIQLTIFSENHLDILQKVFEQTQKPAKVHIKVDTGMHRIGVDYREAVAFVQNCYNLPFIQVEGIFTHLACAESPERTEIQFQRWQDLLRQLEVYRPLPRYLHFANTTGTLCYSQYRFNLVRLGFGFYGYLSQAEESIPQPVLRPVMGLKARIMRLHDAPPESGVSYSYTYRTPAHTPGDQETKIATLPLGYADGIPRSLSNKIEGLLRGVRVPQIGNITMDQMMFDVSAVPDAVVGETMTLLGSESGKNGVQTITLSDWAREAKTIEYELMCALRVRLPKTYNRD